MHECQKLVERYLAKRAQVLPRLTAFTEYRQPYLIVQLRMPTDPVQARANYEQMDHALSAFYG